MIIYKITNTINGKAYIGQTRQTLKARFTAHKSKARNSDSKALLHVAIREFGAAGAIAKVCKKEPKYKTAIGYRFEYYNPDVHDNTVPNLKHIEEGVTTIRKE